MLKINKDYSDYTDETDSNYPEGKGINASTAESYDGTPWLASFMNNIIGAFQGMYKRAYGNTTGIDGKEDTVNKSQFVEAVEKFTDDKIVEHEDKRGLVDNVHGATVEAVGGQLVTRDEFGSAEFSTPLTNAAAARRGDIYDLTKGVLCLTPENDFSKEIPVGKFPGFTLQNESIVKVIFQFGASKKTVLLEETDELTLNVCETGAKKIFAKRDGVVIPLGRYELDKNTSYFQAYTDMNLMFIESLDDGNGGWLILDNPIVLSNNSATSGYTIYADGRKVYPQNVVDNLLKGKLPFTTGQGATFTLAGLKTEKRALIIAVNGYNNGVYYALYFVQRIQNTIWVNSVGRNQLTISVSDGTNAIFSIGGISDYKQYTLWTGILLN